MVNYKELKLKVFKHLPKKYEFAEFMGYIWVREIPPRRKRESIQKYVMTKRLFMKKFGKIRVLLSRYTGYGELYTEMLIEAQRTSNLKDSEYRNGVKWLLPKK